MEFQTPTVECFRGSSKYVGRRRRDPLSVKFWPKSVFSSRPCPPPLFNTPTPRRLRLRVLRYLPVFSRLFAGPREYVRISVVFPTLFFRVDPPVLSLSSLANTDKDSFEDRTGTHRKALRTFFLSCLLSFLERDVQGETDKHRSPLRFATISWLSREEPRSLSFLRPHSFERVLGVSFGTGTCVYRSSSVNVQV